MWLHEMGRGVTSCTDASSFVPRGPGAVVGWPALGVEFLKLYILILVLFSLYLFCRN